MLDAALTQQLRQHLTSLRHPIELVATLDESAKSAELAGLLDEIAALSDLVTVRRDGTNVRVPSFDIVRVGTPVRVTFAGIPLGHEFTSLVLALLHVGGHPPRVSDEVAEQIRAIEGTHHFETFFSLTCQNCPDVVQALNVISVLNPNISHVAIDGAVFKEEAEQRRVMAVPTVFRGSDTFASGRMTVEQIVAMLDTGAAARATSDIDAKDPFDVLIVGGGPAGAASAIYTARKGVRTGVVAERFGGQVLDTMAIENFVSVRHTEGPQARRGTRGARPRARRRRDDAATGDPLDPRRRNPAASSPSNSTAARPCARARSCCRPGRAGGTWTCRARPTTSTRAWRSARTATARSSPASASR